MTGTEQTDVLERVAQTARSAHCVAALSTEVKNSVLQDLATRIDDNRPQLQAANEQDLRAARASGIGDAKLRRLALSAQAVDQMVAGLRQVAALDDPVGRVDRDDTVPSGLRVQKVRTPIGVIMMIYEARPNVTVDAFALCFKAGNACILKGGKEAAHTNHALGRLAHEALEAAGVPTEAVVLITSSDREEMKRLLALDQHIDLVIPRGGNALIRFVHEHSRIPMVQHFHGVCHIFVDASADLQNAGELCTMAKTSAPSACNAVETVLVHEAVAEEFLPRWAEALKSEGVELRGDARVCELVPDSVPATEDDWGTEYLDLIVAARVVAGLDEAIEHIHRHGSNHTDAILTRDDANARKFTDGVRSSCTLVNASTRFNDGFQLGLGAEIGISTSKLHAYGPMGLDELTIQRYVVLGEGHVR